MIWLPLDGPRRGSATFRAYMRGESVGVAGATRRFPTEEIFVARARERLGAKPASELVMSMRECLARHRASRACHTGLDAVAAGTAVVVCTGQQPSVAGGALYTLYKAATAVAAANRLRAHDVPAIAAFWVASDDADVHEAATGFAPGPDRGLVKATLATAVPEGTLVGDIPTAEMSPILRQLFGSDTDGWADAAAEALIARGLEAADLGDALASFLISLFGDSGILIVDSRMGGVRAAAEPVLRAYVECADAIAADIRAAGDAIDAGGGSRALHPKSADSAVFVVGADGRREKVATPRDLLAVDPARWSAGVVVRPFVQEAILPSAGFVAGPGELAYLLETESAGGHLDLERSTFIPRLGMTWVDDHLVDLVSEAGGDEASWRDLLARPDAFRDAALERRVDPALRVPLATLREDLRRHVAALDEAAASVDPNLNAVIESARRKIDHQLNRIDEQILAGVKKRSRADGTELANVAAFLYPRKGLQERTVTFLWLLRHLAPDAISATATRAADAFLTRVWSGRAAHAVSTTTDETPNLDYSEESWDENSASA